jgi:hypothetical protein
MQRTTLGLLLMLAIPAAAIPATAGTACLGSSIVAIDDTCTFKPSFKVGQRMVYKYSSLVEHLPEKKEAAPAAVPPADGAEPEPPLRSYAIEMTLRLTVMGVDEHGGASFALLPDDIVIDTKTTDLDINAGFTRKQAEAKSPLPEGAGFLPRLSLALARTAIRLDVRADGTISEVAGLDDVYEIAVKEGPEGRRVVGPLAPDAIKRNLGALFRIDEPDKGAGEFPARKTGDTWRLLDRATQPGGRDIVSTTTLKLESCAPDRAEITGAGVMVVEAPAGEAGKEPPKPDPGQGVPTIEEQSDALAVTWDPSAGILKKRTRDTLMAVSARLGAERRNALRFRTRTSFELVESSE